MGDLINLNPGGSLVIPDEIARDSEVAAAIAAHVAAANPHPQYLGKTEKAVDAELIDGIDSDRIWHEGNTNIGNINSKLLSGNFPPGNYMTLDVPHGLTMSKVQGFQFMGKVMGENRWASLDSTNFDTPENVRISLHETFFRLSNYNDDLSEKMYGQPFKILVFYSP